MATLMETVDVEVYFDIEEYIDEASDDALINELRRRKIGITEDDLSKPFVPHNLEGDKLKRHLCDILDSSYVISHENLLTQLKERLNN